MLKLPKIFTTILALIAMLNFASASTIVARPAPEFTQTSPEAWLGSKPLSMADLRGKVVLVDFWTFTCWNCYRSFPWLNALEEKFVGKNFQVIVVILRIRRSLLAAASISSI